MTNNARPPTRRIIDPVVTAAATTPVRDRGGGPLSEAVEGVDDASESVLATEVENEDEECEGVIKRRDEESAGVAADAGRIVVVDEYVVGSVLVETSWIVFGAAADGRGRTAKVGRLADVSDIVDSPNVTSVDHASGKGEDAVDSVANEAIPPAESASDIA